MTVAAAPRRRDLAVVLGASVAGLAAAAALQRHFAAVVVVERDPLPDEPVNRRGVPQGHHTHALMTGGRDALDELLPGFSARMIAAGVPLLDQPRDVAFLTAQGWLARAPTGVETLFARRPTLELVVRRLVSELPGVTIVRGTATGLLGAPGGARVTGVQLGGDERPTSLPADLVVDATGRASRAPKWLEALGHAPPPEIEVQPYLGYASRLLRIPDDAWPDEVRGIIALPYPGATRGGAVLVQDDGYAIITACGAAKDFPPADEEAFAAFLGTATTPLLGAVVARGEPVSEIVTTRTSTNRLRCFHRLPVRPPGFLCVGDAICALNPAYGQGMTNAARQALELGRMLGAPGVDDDAVVDGFPARVVEINAFAWGVATASDLAFPTTRADGLPPPTPEELAAGAYMERLQRAATADPWLVGRLQGAINRMDPTPLFAADVRSRVDGWDARERPAWSTDRTRVPALSAG